MNFKYLKNNYKLAPIDLIEHYVLHADPKAIQQIDLKNKEFKKSGILNQEGNTTIFFVYEEVKRFFYKEL